MVPLKAQQLLLQGLYLSFQISLIQGQLIQDPAQAIGVCFYQLPQGQLCLIPTKRSGSTTKGWNRIQNSGKALKCWLCLAQYETNGELA